MNRWDRMVDAATMLAALSVLVVAAVVLSKALGGAPDTLTRPDRMVPEWREYVDEGHWMGPRDAKVVIIEFGDYECSSCRAVAPHIDAVRSAFREDVAVVYRHWPLSYHYLAYPAARAAECAAAQGLFDPFHEWLYTDTEWMANPRGRFEAFAAQLGMPELQVFGTCLDDLDPVPSIERDMAAVEEIGGTGTPTILVNGLLLGSPADSLTLTRLVRTALAGEELVEPER